MRHSLQAFMIYAPLLPQFLTTSALPLPLSPAHFAPPPDFTNITLWPAKHSKFLTPSSSDLSPRWWPASQQPPAFICPQVDFQGDCVLVAGNAKDVCLSMPLSTTKAPARSVRIGEGVECEIYNDHACTGSSISLSAPSTPDLLHANEWAARIKSLYCEALMVHARTADLSPRDANQHRNLPSIGKCWWHWNCLKHHFARSAPAVDALPPVTVVQRHGATAHIEQPTAPLDVPLPKFSYDPPKLKGRREERREDLELDADQMPGLPGFYG